MHSQDTLFQRIIKDDLQCGVQPEENRLSCSWQRVNFARKVL